MLFQNLNARRPHLWRHLGLSAGLSVLILVHNVLLCQVHNSPSIGDDPFPQLLINEETNAVNLEHILPLNPSAKWKIDADAAKGYHKRLGNLALLKASDNVEIGNGEFAEKIGALSNSPFEWTKEIPRLYNDWGVDQIRERQRRMANAAPKVWPL
jgi:Protein of unknown function (DUF1524)